MKMRRNFSLIFIFLLLLIQMPKADDLDIEITPDGYGAIEAGQIVKGLNREVGSGEEQKIDHIWQQRVIANIGFQALINSKLKINLAGGGLLAFSFPQIQQAPLTMFPRKSFYIKRADAQYSLGDMESPFMDFQVGLFPYKYNENVRNLGEYLFRSSLYPVVLYTDFNYAMADIMGIRIGNDIKFLDGAISIKNDLMLHSELYGIPVQDWSVSDVLTLNLFDFFQIGGGVSFNRLFSVYKGKNYRPGWMDFYYDDDDDDFDRIAEEYANNPLAFNPEYDTIISGGDTTYDTTFQYMKWNDTKVMARLSFDFKRLIPVDIFGESDLRLYGEVNVLGLTNYDKNNSRDDYKYIEDRMISSFGFNFPGFKIIDVINMEWEFSSNPYEYSYDRYFGTPPDRFPTRARKNPWKWSVYVKKTFFDGHLGLSTQFARDHKKIDFHYFERKYMDFNESLPYADHWWWVVRTEFNF